MEKQAGPTQALAIECTKSVTGCCTYNGAYNCKRELESRLTPLQIWRTDTDSTSVALKQQQLPGAPII